MGVPTRGPQQFCALGSQKGTLWATNSCLTHRKLSLAPPVGQPRIPALDNCGFALYAHPHSLPTAIHCGPT